MNALVVSIPEWIAKSRCLRVSTSTGTGKSTRIPAALAQAGFTVWASIPTTLAARAVYQYVRAKHPKLAIGLAMDGVRLHDSKTQLLFGTTQSIKNMLLRLLSRHQSDQKLVVVMDEFHHPSPVVPNFSK